MESSTKPHTPRDELPDTELRNNSLPIVLDVRTVTETGGGPEKTILLGARWLQDRGWPAYCVYLHPPGDLGFETIRNKVSSLGVARFIELEDRGPLDWRLVGRLVALCREIKPAIWHGHDYKSDALGWLIHRFYPLKLVSTVHGWGVPGRRVWLYHWIHRLCLRGFDQVLCVSAEQYAVCRRAGIPPAICEVLENGVDCQAFRPAVDSAARKHSLGIVPNRFVLGYVGRFSKEKNLALLLDVARKLIERTSDVHLLLVGDGPERRDLHVHAERLGITGHVTFTGYATDPRPYYSAMDAFILLSRSEGLPNVLLEAMAMGIPAICTPVGGIPGVIDPDNTGLLVSLDDVSAIVAAVQRLMDNPQLAARLGQNGRQHVETHYSFDRRMERLCGIYRDLVSRDASARTRLANP
jgi:glycosyltransferase involved in cell wall biosynthesis